MTDPTPTRDEAVRELELIRRLVIPMVRERSREPGDAWDQAERVLSALASAPAPASGGVDAVARLIWNRWHARHGGDYDGAKGTLARADTEGLAKQIIASLSPAATQAPAVDPNVERLLTAAKAAKRYLEPDLVEPGRTVFWTLVSAINAMEGKP
ncbi:hypothetical protein J2X48_000695 [Bosea sp. BE271]|uniref:hypothetical protein n=1 Tax=Bosea TaxID=85413 RepID=UPI002862C9B2|nr:MULTISPECIES: hypothetical protein [Bosea]MDR6826501.1 hypothetical protein [Bosea robiniae]MDR6893211.1 hypothetical protein [Bosea sp. BE109]MDR7137090.1 hypothetical protein [Bosea sp. BE168]MDR7173789.1 hypothetical protein [Bosea sp. BE271]